MIFKRPSELAQSIACNMRRDPDAWKLTSYRVQHDEGLEVRVGCGVGGVAIIHPHGAELDRLPRADKRLIWAAYRVMLAHKMTELVLPEAEGTAE